MISDKIVFFHPTSCNRDLFTSDICLYFHYEELPLAFPFQKLKISFSTWKTSYSPLPYGNLYSLQSVFIHDDDFYGLFLLG